MRAVFQRVKSASVDILDDVKYRSGEISKGALILLGVETDDTLEDAKWLVNKIAQLRVYEDDNAKMNFSIKDVNGDALVVSQFTLFGNLKKGSRPSFNRAAIPSVSNPLYEKFVELLGENLGKKIQTGVFGAMMDVSLVNDGPITIILDSKRRDF